MPETPQTDPGPTAPDPASAVEPLATVNIARCPKHGLHGERDECFVCSQPVERVAMVPLSEMFATGLRWCPECGMVYDEDRLREISPSLRCEINGAGAETFPMYAVRTKEGVTDA